MSNFQVPVVGNQNGGFSNGDQVTAENLNAHVMDAIPTGDFIATRTESTTVNPTDYYLKVESDGNLYRIASSKIGANAETADHTTLKVGIIQAHGSGDGGSTPYSSITLNNTGNLQFNLGAYSDPADNHSGSFTINAHGYFCNFKIPHVHDNSQGNPNQFYIGDEAHRSTFIVNSVQTHFRNTWPADFSYNKKALILPTGTTAERPVAENGLGGVGSGMFRYNNEINDVEFYGTDAQWSGTKSKLLSVGFKTGWCGINGDGILYRSTAEWDIPADETWVVNFQAQWQAANGGNTNPDWYYYVRAFATKNTYVDVEIKQWMRNFPAKSGVSEVAVGFALTRNSMANMSKKLEIRSYGINSNTALGGIVQGSVTSSYVIFVYRYKTSAYESLNAIL